MATTKTEYYFSVYRPASCASNIGYVDHAYYPKHVLEYKDVEQVYVCGGGARNEFLLEQLESELHECELFSTDELGVEADAVEAMAFAWLAYAYINDIQGSIASVTGATKGAVLGTFCPGRE